MRYRAKKVMSLRRLRRIELMDIFLRAKKVINFRIQMLCPINFRLQYHSQKKKKKSSQTPPSSKSKIQKEKPNVLLYPMLCLRHSSKKLEKVLRTWLLSRQVEQVIWRQELHRDRENKKSLKSKICTNHLYYEQLTQSLPIARPKAESGTCHGARSRWLILLSQTIYKDCKEYGTARFSPFLTLIYLKLSNIYNILNKFLFLHTSYCTNHLSAGRFKAQMYNSIC